MNNPCKHQVALNPSWLISIAIAFSSGFETGKIKAEYEAREIPTLMAVN